MATGKRRETILRRSLKTTQSHTYGHQKNPSSPRPISTGLLHALLRFQIRPINLVVYQGTYSLKGMGELISRKVSRLYAFSAYPDQTSLPSYATGVTTGSQEVCSSRSSRTKDNPSQISYAHHR